MSMNTHVLGIKQPDETWKKMMAVYESCILANVPVPESVLIYFEYKKPTSEGALVDLDKATFVVKWSAEMENGFVIDLKALQKEHPGITHIRFYNSY